MPELHLDCPAGISGDMFLAAMADLGVDFGPVGEAFARAGVEVEIAAQATRDKGVAGRRMDIRAPGAQPLRHLADLTGIVRALPLSEGIRARSEAAFARLAEVEAAVHGCAV